MSTTPGPWFYDGYLIYSPKHASSQHRNGRVLVAVVGFDSEDDGRLISAAPDLLTAAAEALLYLYKLPDNWKSKTREEMLEKAIAKAEVDS